MNCILLLLLTLNSLTSVYLHKFTYSLYIQVTKVLTMKENFSNNEEFF